MARFFGCGAPTAQVRRTRQSTSARIPGTPVYAPVSGEVLEVRPYYLYGEYADFEIHITPNGWAEVDVVLIHVDNVQVVEG